MKYRGILLSILTMALLATFIQPAHADWVEVDKFTGTMYISDKGLVKNIATDKSGMWSIMDLNDGSITMVDPRKKTYTIIFPEKFCSQVTTMMDNMMSEMTAEDRAMMEQMMGAGGKRPSPRVRVTKKGSGGVVAGNKTDRYIVTVNGKPFKDVYLAPNASIMKDVRKFITKSTEMSAQMESCSQMGPGVHTTAPEMSKEYLGLAQKGWTMKEVNTDSGKVEKEVLSLKKKSIPSSEFRVPTGYKKVEMRRLMGGGR
ncbi:MAG: hypothetical protein ACE5EZ_05280 [Thermodesulfobacteriota bacterium]